jgi:diguanylate cyclase (GGDEF)-like protein
MNRPRRRPDPDFQERYGVLLDIGRILTGTLQPDELYRTIYEQASRVIETTGFYISLYDEEQDQGTVVFYADRGAIERPNTTYRGSDSRAIREARPILEDFSRPDEAVLLLGAESDEEVTRSVVAVPMRHEGRVLGVISAQSYRSSAYAESDVEILTALADLAAVAVHNARSVSELDHQRRESQRLEEIARALSSSLELDHVLERILVATQELVESDGAGVWLLRTDGRAELARTIGQAAMPAQTVIPVPEEFHRRVRRDRSPLVLDRAQATGLLPPETAARLSAESAIAVPLMAEDELIGALTVTQQKARRYLPRDIRLLERLGFHAAIAVANARLHEQVRLLSLTDPLTGLPNRRHMDIFLDKEFAAAERGRALTVVLFDLDEFKAYNDSAGHQAGDAALCRFAAILAGQTRAMNLAARYGGDEFIAILSDTGEEGARVLVSRIMDEIAGDSLLARIGASFGIASYAAGMLGPGDLVRRADAALYDEKARREGRLRT